VLNLTLFGLMKLTAQAVALGFVGLLFAVRLPSKIAWIGTGMFLLAVFAVCAYASALLWLVWVPKAIDVVVRSW
jgi:hypothetical protein